MFQFEFEGALFRFEAKAPTIKPLLQEPPTRAAFYVPLLLYNKKNFRAFGFYMGENSPKPPYCKGGLQERDAPRLQDEFEGALFRSEAQAPTSKPLPQEPPTRA